jgi:hypothetical protein
MSLIILFVMLPISIYFFVGDVRIEWLSYDWGIIHDPRSWNTVVYLPPQGVRTFDRYIAPVFAVIVFLFFGMGNEAMRIYKMILCWVGLGYCFPRLKEGGRRGSVDAVEDVDNSWLGKLSLVQWAKKWLERAGLSHPNSKTSSKVSNESKGSRKGSVAYVEHVNAGLRRGSNALPPMAAGGIVEWDTMELRPVGEGPQPVLPDPDADADDSDLYNDAQYGFGPNAQFRGRQPDNNKKSVFGLRRAAAAKAAQPRPSTNDSDTPLSHVRSISSHELGGHSSGNKGEVSTVVWSPNSSGSISRHASDADMGETASIGEAITVPERAEGGVRVKRSVAMGSERMV